MMVFALTPESRLTQNIARNLNLSVGEMTRRKLANTETLVEIRVSGSYVIMYSVLSTLYTIHYYAHVHCMSYCTVYSLLHSCIKHATLKCAHST